MPGKAQQTHKFQGFTSFQHPSLRAKGPISAGEAHNSQGFAPFQQLNFEPLPHFSGQDSFLQFSKCLNPTSTILQVEYLQLHLDGTRKLRSSFSKQTSRTKAQALADSRFQAHTFYPSTPIFHLLQFTDRRRVGFPSVF